MNIYEDYKHIEQTLIEVWSCDNCPMCDSSGEYDSYCQHPEEMEVDRKGKSSIGSSTMPKGMEVHLDCLLRKREVRIVLEEGV